MQKSGCDKPFFLVNHEKPGEGAIHLVTRNDSLKPDDDKSCDEIEHKSAAMIPEEKKDIRHERARKYSVIMKEMEERVGERSDCEEMMQPIKHLSAKTYGSTVLFLLHSCVA